MASCSLCPMNYGPRQSWAHSLFLVSLLAVFVSLASCKSVIYVSTSGSNTPSCGSEVETACANISYALSRRVSDDTTVFILPGRYFEESSRLSRLSSLNIIGQSASVSCVDRNGPLFALSSVQGNISGLIISNCQDNDGGAIQITQGSNIGLSNISLTDVEGFRGGAILVSESSADAQTLVISNSKASFYGGAILLRNGSSMSWSKGSLTTTHSTSGGAVAVLEGSSFVGSDIKVSGSDTFGLAYGVGGFLYANASTAALTRMTFVSGTAGFGAAVAAVDAAHVSISRCDFTSLVSSTAGGAVWASGNFTRLFIDQSNFIKNSAGRGGGGAVLISQGAFASVSGCLFSANFIGANDYKTAAPGGAILVTNSSYLQVRDSTFQNQKLYAFFGAGLGAIGNASRPYEGPDVTISGCVFSDNEIQYSYSLTDFPGGSAIALIGTSNSLIENTRVFRNKQGYSSNGALLAAYNAKVTIVNASFHLNSGSNTAAAYFVGGGLLQLQNVSLTNNTCGISCTPGFFFDLKPPFNAPPAMWNISGLHAANNQRGDQNAILVQVSGPGNSTFSMKHSRIENNLSGGLGIYTSSQDPRPLSSAVEIEHSTITRHRNSAGANIGYLIPSLTFRNVTFSNNSAKNGGGALISGNIFGPVLFDNCSFIENIASESGGGLSISRGYDNFSPALRGCLFEGNVASQYGGGLMVRQSAAPNISNTVFRRNKAGSCGGGIMSYENANPWIQESVFQGNGANFGGGACAIATSRIGEEGSDLTSINAVQTRFSDNVAFRSGGALYLNNILGTKYQQRRVVLDQVTFQGNIALGNQSGSYYSPRDGGGALFCRLIWSSESMTNLRFTNNSAPNTPLTHHLSATGCGQLATFNCDKCSASDANCLLSGDEYGGRCACASTDLNPKYCTPSANPLRCFGVSSTSRAVCSGSGECVGPDQCLCNLDRSGQNCEFQRVELKVALPSMPLPFVNCTNGLCPSIQSALWFIQNVSATGANARAGFLISLSEGTFQSAPIALPPNSNIRGLGAGSSLVGTLGTYAALLSAANTDNWVPPIRIENIKFSNSTTGLSIGPGVFWIRRVSVQDIKPLGYSSGTGSGIGIAGGRVVIEDGTVSNCAGVGVGGISASGGQITIKNTEVSYNRQWAANGFPTGLGFAIRGGCGPRFQNCYQGEAIIQNSYFHHQKDGPSIGVDGGSKMTVINSTISENLSSGVSVGLSYTRAPRYPVVHITNSAFLRNAGSGVVIYASTALIEKSLFAFNNNTAVFILKADSLTLRDLKVLNNTSSGDSAAGISVHGLSRGITVSELSRLVISGNNGSRWGDAGGIDCLGPYVLPTQNVKDIYLDDNFAYLDRGQPNVVSWNQCSLFPQGKNCTACATVGSHCVLNATSCACQVGFSGPNCNVPAATRRLPRK